MASFATPSDLATYLGLAGVTTGRAQQMLDAASELIRTFTDQQLDVVVDDVVRLEGTDRPTLLLPERPVTAVTYVKLDTVTVTSTDYLVFTSGLIQRVNGGEWQTATPWGIEVKYTHGYATIPADVKTICLQAAARALSLNERSASEALGGTVMETAGFAPEVFLTPGEKMILVQYGPVGVG